MLPFCPTHIFHIVIIKIKGDHRFLNRMKPDSKKTCQNTVTKIDLKVLSNRGYSCTKSLNNINTMCN